MEKITTAVEVKKKAVTRLTKNSKLFKTIINAIQDKKGEGIISLDLRKIDEAVADYFIVCDAKSHIQVKAIAQHIAETIELECGERPYNIAFSDTWTLVDYVNIVVHVFQHDQRLFYDLEGVWEDAPKANHDL